MLYDVKEMQCFGICFNSKDDYNKIMEKGVNKMKKVDNAIIMAAGTSSRFAPLSYEIPKALIEIKGEVLIERQIKQIQEAGIKEIIIVTGYKKEKFEYLKEKYGVKLVHNEEYLNRNNNSSIYVVREYIKNSYICSADNYFTKNPFESEVEGSYYSAIYSEGETKEWCLEYDEKEEITKVTIGGKDAWFMLGHAFWDEEFSKRFIPILENIYELEETKDLFWENIYMNHLDKLKMKIRKYTSDIIFEFDTLDELREFDRSYIEDTRSKILKKVAEELNVSEKEIEKIRAYKEGNNAASGFTFECKGKEYKYSYKAERMI